MTFDNSSANSCNVTLPGPSLQSLCSAAEFIYFMTALDDAIRENTNISRNCERIKLTEEPADEYDFIVAGGGGAGAVVAGSLADTKNWKILVLEAGKDESAAGQIPSFTGTLIGSEIDWNYYTNNESYACLSTNGSCYWSSARSLGGNTAHNGMVHLRGNPTDYNGWAKLGNIGWEWDKVLEAYKKQEDNANIDEVGSEYHGKGGQLSVGYFPYRSEFKNRILNASEESGFGVSTDLNGKDLTGFTIIQATQKDGVRVSSATAYLRPQRNNENLHISAESFVTKIIIENNTAVGVEYMKGGQLRQAYAKKEVIVSTGTVRSPQLLLLSGIGPKEHLESHNIPVVVDMPGVGENLHDHVAFTLTFTVNEPDTYDNNEQVAEQYLTNQTGPMSVIGESNLIGMGYTNQTTPDYPDLLLQLYGHVASCAPGEVGALASDGNAQINIIVNYVHPQSRGRISLASNDSSDHPFIWGNYLGEENDLERIIDGIEQALNLVETEALQEYNLTLSETPVEACSNYTIPSREYWACAIRQNTGVQLHQVGTCKMGPTSDPMAVVDPELRVYNIEHLRVMDASIMPKVTSANTAAPVMMIAARGAEFIKNTWLNTTVE